MVKGINRRRLLQLGLAGSAGLLVAALGGCGEEKAAETAAPTTAAAEATTAAPAAAPAGKVVEIRFVAMDYDSRTLPDQQAMIDAFNKSQSRIKASVEVVSWDDGLTVLTTQLQAGAPPDVANHGSGQMATWNTEGVIEPLDPFVGDFKKELVPATVEAMTIDGKLMGMPYFMDPRGLWYRPDLFEQKGVAKAPTTWDELREAAKKLHSPPDVFGIGWSAGYGDWWWYSWVGAIGRDGDRVPYDKQGKSRHASEEGLAAVQLMVDLARTDQSTQPDPANAHRDKDLQPLFLAGKLAMLETGSWFKTIIQNDAPKLAFDVAQLPIRKAGIKPSNAFWPDTVVMFKASKNKEAAAELLKFMFTKQNRLLWAQQRGVIPERTDVVTDPAWAVSKFEKFFGEELKISHNIFRTPFPATLERDLEAVNNGAVQAVLGEKGVEEAMKEAAATIDKSHGL